MSAPTAIVLGCDLGGWGAIQSLAALGCPIVGVSYHPYDVAHRSRFLLESIRLRSGADDPAATLAVLERLAPRHPGAVVLPADDGALLTVAEHLPWVRSLGLRAACASASAVRTVVQKASFYRFAEGIGLPVAKTWFGKPERELDYPCVVKPSRSHEFFERFGEKLFLARDEAELDAAVARAAAAELEVVVQEFVPGGDDAIFFHTVHVGADGGLRGEVFVRKVRQAPPLFGVSCLARTVEPLEDMRRSTRLALEKLGWRGYAGVEYKTDERDGTHRIMEVNGRIVRSAKLDLATGAPLAQLAYLDACGAPLPEPCVGRAGVPWIEVLGDLERHPGRPRELLAACRVPHRVFADLAWRDPAPTLARIVAMAPRIAKAWGRWLLRRRPGLRAARRRHAS